MALEAISARERYALLMDSWTELFAGVVGGDPLDFPGVQKIRLNGPIPRPDVQPGDFITVPFQLPAQIAAHKAQTSGDQGFHTFAPASRFASSRSCRAMMAHSCS